MVVDDVVAVRKLVVRGLKDLGYQDVVEAVDGSQAWELYSRADSEIGLIISDWNMPNMTGLDLLIKVREHAPKIPFFLLTAEAEQNNVRAAVEHKVTGYIIKPFTLAALKKRLGL
jgi:two-component system chemotaxis response regulator CheY